MVCGCYLPTRNLSRLIKLGGIRVVRKHGTRCAVRKESGLEKRVTAKNYIVNSNQLRRNCIRAVKRKFNSEKQAQLDQIHTHDKVKFWKEIDEIDGKKGDRVPFEVYTPDYIITSDPEIVLSRWHEDYSTLSTDNNDGVFNDDVLISVIKMVCRWNLRMILPLYSLSLLSLKRHQMQLIL